MGKRKKSSRKPGPARRTDPLETTFTCLFCHHDKSVNVKIDRKEGLAQLQCRICGQRYQGKVNHLTEPIDVYSEWIDAADAAQKDTDGTDVVGVRHAAPSTSRSAPPDTSDPEDD